LKNISTKSVWDVFTPLAQKHQAINLGQGFPGWSPPDFVRQAACDAIQEVGADFMANQYARSAGQINLVHALAKKYQGLKGEAIDPLSEIVVLNGASGALYVTAVSLLQEGDEVVTFEPAFDLYFAQADMAGATVRNVSMHAKNGVWSYDFEELRRAFNSKTRMFILNTPHNPTGKVFTRSELELISALVQQFPRVVIVSDEVYEHLTYDIPHISIASLPNMWHRTLTISSAGKTFSTTGWKIGWVIGPKNLIQHLATSHAFITYAVCTPLQLAVARLLTIAEKPYQDCTSYYQWINQQYRRKRDLLIAGLRDARIQPVVPEGGFFIMGSSHELKVPDKWLSNETRDWSLARWLCVDIGVCCIPPSSFCSPQTKHLVANYLRFAFCKPDDVIAEGIKRLKKLSEQEAVNSKL